MISSKTFDQNGEIQDAYYWHHFYLYQDPEFVSDIKKVRDVLEEKYYEGITFDLDRIKANENIQFRHEPLIRGLAKKYGTDNWGITYFADGWYDKKYPLVPEFTDVKVSADGQLTLLINKHTTLEHIRKMWKLVESYKKSLYGVSNPKVKPPENPSLLYAIHKARRHDETFKQIFDSYRGGDLDGYQGSADQFTSQEKLKDYFYKYRLEV